MLALAENKKNPKNKVKLEQKQWNNPLIVDFYRFNHNLSTSAHLGGYTREAQFQDTSAF